MQGFANKTGRVDNNGLRLEIPMLDKPLFVEVTARKVMIEYVPQSYLDVASECRVLPWGPWLALPERSLGESEKHSRTKTLTHAVTLLYHIVHIYNSHCHMPLTSKFTEGKTRQMHKCKRRLKTEHIVYFSNQLLPGPLALRRATTASASCYC